MPKITFHHPSGHTETLEADSGTSIMRAAVLHGVTGIVGECGGQAMCATCHVYVRDAYLDALPSIGEDEDEMLDCTTAARDEARSRLGCQIRIGSGIDEIEIDLPERQV